MRPSQRPQSPTLPTRLLLFFELDVLLSLSLVLEEDLFLGFAAVMMVLGEFDDCFSNILGKKGDGDGPRIKERGGEIDGKEEKEWRQVE